MFPYLVFWWCILPYSSKISHRCSVELGSGDCEGYSMWMISIVIKPFSECICRHSNCLKIEFRIIGPTRITILIYYYLLTRRSSWTILQYTQSFLFRQDCKIYPPTFNIMAVNFNVPCPYKQLQSHISVCVSSCVLSLQLILYPFLSISVF